MPMYEYECAACGKFEVKQRMSEAPLAECTRCGASVRRLISTTSFALKGGGWYGDGYASGKGGKTEAAPAVAAAAPAAASAPAAAPSKDPKAVGGCGAGACGTGACASALPN